MSEQKDKLMKGGALLIEDAKAEDIFTQEDYTYEHKMIVQTTEDFVVGEVLPVIDKLENHEFEYSVKLLEKAGELGLLSADIPEEYGGVSLDNISSALITEKFCQAQGISVTHRATDAVRTLPIVFFGNEEQ